MFTSTEITAEEHHVWLDRNLGNAFRPMLIYVRGGVSLGFVGLRLGRHPRVGDWGFYTAPDAPRGTGRAMARGALDHAFGALALHKVCGQALEANTRSIGFHRALGFREEGVLREHHFDGTRFQAVVCFGLLAHEWAANAVD